MLENARKRVSCFTLPGCFRSGGKHDFFGLLVHTDAKDSGNMSDNVQGNGRIVGKNVLDLFCLCCPFSNVLDCTGIN